MTDLLPPHPLWQRAREKLAPTPAMQVAQNWLTSEAWGLLMLGGVGRGKSQAAAWLHLRLREEAIRVAQAPGVYERPGDVLWLRARVLQQLPWHEREKVLGRCAPAYGLVVDELGAEDTNTIQTLSDLLEDRGDQCRHTVITTNLDRASFGERYGDRLVDRLRAGGLNQRGLARWAVEISGESLRGLSPEEIEQIVARETRGAPCR